FLDRAGAAAGTHAAGTPPAMLRPDVVLFNGGFFTPAVAQARVLDALEAWFGVRPEVLTNDSPEAAVAVGAAFYGALRRAPRQAAPLIRAGSARCYYIALHGNDGAGTRTVVCVLPRGTEEGTRLE